MLTGVAAILLAATGMLLNHSAWLGLGGEGPPRVQGSGGLTDVAPINDLLKAALRAAVERDVRILNRRGGARPASGPSAIDRAVFRPETRTVQVRLRDPLATEIVLDWSSGALLRISPRHDVRLRGVHAATILDPRGVGVSDVVAIVLIVLGATGTLLWIRRRRDRNRPTETFTRWWLFNWWLHRAGGLAAAAYLVVLSVTGLLLNHKRELGLMLEPVRELEAEHVARLTPSGLHVILRTAVQVLAQRAPATTADDVVFVDYRPLRGYAKVRFRPRDMEVIVDAYDGGILSTARRHDRWIEELHSGLLFGSYGPLLSDFTSVLLILLTLNGLYLWVMPTWIGRGRPQLEDVHP